MHNNCVLINVDDCLCHDLQPALMLQVKKNFLGSAARVTRGAVLGAVLILSGCQPDTNASAPDSSVSSTADKEISLAIVGYNYTNREIGHFTVDGVGGGNVHVSGPRGGGGGIACCARYYADGEPAHYAVRWNIASCKYDVHPQPNDEPTFALHDSYKEEKITAAQPPSGIPRYLELHFFSDGSVKALITTELSEPMLQLPADRESDWTPQCPDNKRPPIQY